jgi:hypothetical protein
MINASGFAIIAHILEEMPRQYITVSTVEKLDKLVTFIECLPGPSPLYEEVLKYILFNFSIWAFTEPPVQLKLFESLTIHTTSKGQVNAKNTENTEKKTKDVLMLVFFVSCS